MKRSLRGRGAGCRYGAVECDCVCTCFYYCMHLHLTPYPTPYIHPTYPSHSMHSLTTLCTYTLHTLSLALHAHTPYTPSHSQHVDLHPRLQRTSIAPPHDVTVRLAAATDTSVVETHPVPVYVAIPIAMSMPCPLPYLSPYPPSLRTPSYSHIQISHPRAHTGIHILSQAQPRTLPPVPPSRRPSPTIRPSLQFSLSLPSTLSLTLTCHPPGERKTKA